MPTLTPLASSSAGNAYVLDDGRSRLLLECGLSWPKLREQLGFQSSGLAGVLLTHEHGDHAKGVQGAMAAGLDVYASKGTFEALDLTGHRCRTVQPLTQFQVGSWSVMPFEAIHDAAEPLGFLLASKDSKCLFLTDSAYCRYRFKGLTHVFVECNHSLEIMRRRTADEELHMAHKKRLMHSHMSLERLQEMLAANDLSQVREIHLLHLSDDNSDEGHFRRAIMRQTGKPVYVAPRG